MNVFVRVASMGMFLAAVAAGQNAPATLGVADKASAGQWAMANVNPDIKKPTTAWLAVQPMSSANTITVTVETPFDATIAPSQTGSATCITASAHKIVCSASAKGPLLLEYTVTAQSAGTLRLLALIEYSGKNVSQSGYVVASDPMTVRSTLEFGPAAIAIISAVFGLIAGMLTQWFTSLRQERLDDRKRIKEEELAIRKGQRDVENALLTGLAPEILTNQTALKNYIDGGGTPPKLSVVKYDTLMKNEAVLGYLNVPSRQSYLKNIDALYEAVQTYHGKINRREAPEAIQAEALKLFETLKRSHEVR